MHTLRICHSQHPHKTASLHFTAPLEATKHEEDMDLFSRAYIINKRKIPIWSAAIFYNVLKSHIGWEGMRSSSNKKQATAQDHTPKSQLMQECENTHFFTKEQLKT